MWGGWTLLVVAAGWVMGALAVSLPYRIDQAAHVVSEEDVDGFSASRLAGYGVNVVVGGGLDGATFLNAIPGGPWCVPGRRPLRRRCLFIVNTCVK